VVGQRHAPAALHPRRAPVPIVEETGEPQGRSGRIWRTDNLLPPGVRTPDRQARSESNRMNHFEKISQLLLCILENQFSVIISGAGYFEWLSHFFQKSDKSLNYARITSCYVLQSSLLKVPFMFLVYTTYHTHCRIRYQKKNNHCFIGKYLNTSVPP
jgi:hypothetical protein